MQAFVLDKHVSSKEVMSGGGGRGRDGVCCCGCLSE